MAALFVWLCVPPRCRWRECWIVVALAVFVERVDIDVAFATVFISREVTDVDRLPVQAAGRHIRRRQAGAVSLGFVDGCSARRGGRKRRRGGGSALCGHRDLLCDSGYECMYYSTIMLTFASGKSVDHYPSNSVAASPVRRPLGCDMASSNVSAVACAAQPSTVVPSGWRTPDLPPGQPIPGLGGTENGGRAGPVEAQERVAFVLADVAGRLAHTHRRLRVHGYSRLEGWLLTGCITGCGSTGCTGVMRLAWACRTAERLAQ